MTLHIESTDHFKKEILEHKGLAVIDFRASRCGPCRMLGPIIDQLAKKYTEVKIAKVNVEEQQELARAFQISSIPVVYFIKEGQVVERIVGVNPLIIYEEKITEHSVSAKTVT